MKDKDVAKGIGILIDFAATMGKSAVEKVFDPEVKDETMEDTRKKLKKSFREQLKVVISKVLDDEDEEEGEKKDRDLELSKKGNK